MTSGAPDPFVGRVVDGRYRIDSLLGQGAVGAVYKAADVQGNGTVALKIWHETALDDQTRARFVREAKALDALRHPNIVAVYAAGVVDQLPYMAMELLQGETLEDMLEDEEPLPTETALAIAQQMLSALAFAHERNVVHRDLKPENVFVARGTDGQPVVKLLDYGLAKFMAPTDDPLKGQAITMMGMVMGTPLYMPPEQAIGSAIDVRVDVYAATCVLFEMLSGRLPFLGNSHADLIRAHMMDPIPKLAELRDDVQVSSHLQALFDRGMAKKPDQRYSSAGEMLRALGAIPQPIKPGSATRAGPPAAAFRPDAVTEVFVRQAKTGIHPAIWGAGIGAILVLLAALAFVMLRA